MSGILIVTGLILAWISTCLVDAPLSVIALVGGTGVALMVGGYIWPKAARAVQRKKERPDCGNSRDGRKEKSLNLIVAEERGDVKWNYHG